MKTYSIISVLMVAMFFEFLFLIRSAIRSSKPIELLYQNELNSDEKIGPQNKHEKHYFCLNFSQNLQIIPSSSPHLIGYKIHGKILQVSKKTEINLPKVFVFEDEKEGSYYKAQVISSSNYIEYNIDNIPYCENKTNSHQVTESANNEYDLNSSDLETFENETSEMISSFESTEEPETKPDHTLGTIIGLIVAALFLIACFSGIIIMKYTQHKEEEKFKKENHVEEEEDNEMNDIPEI